MFRGRLLFAADYISLLVHVLFCVNCCNSSSCGDIHNISFPFRLNSDPVDNCGYKYVELECENNRREDKEEVEKEESEVRHRRKSIHTFWSEATILLIGQMLQTYAASTCFFPTRPFQLPDGRLRNMTSLLEVHNALADGFDLYWDVYSYEYCRLQAHCSSNYTQNVTAAV
ncbi:hypothetical protein LOK49_LG07G00240 [Camellia lanceoleosa]|uniref:Uncharacterized protein n=1 Tax=Camellia lanceoleosa TaxID=1840588 RepID=A0ACC0H4M8_9ERIC|nr:hypothetical protein LOK49_LG07G00240 [Camellia lanceoleosa]